MKKIIFSISLFLLIHSLFGQNLNELDSYTIDEFYKKIELDYGTLDEYGNLIDFIFVKTELDAGKYEITLSDSSGDLYQINNTNIYIAIQGYFGYAGYSTDCILEVDSYYLSTIYKKE